MKKVNLFFALFLVSIFSSFAQRAVLVNGGQFGNPNENVNVVIYDISTQTYTTVDTIHTNSVQDILIDGNEFYVLAQDSIVKYDSQNLTRLAAQAFSGPSTKTVLLSGNELLVGNWYGKSSNNVYIYNASNLQLVDSLSTVELGATSMLLDSNFLYITQNQSTASFTDTLGVILKVNVSTRQIVDSIRVANYTEGFGELIRMPNGTGFYSINSGSNTITSVDFSTLNATNTSFNQNLRVGNRSQWSSHADTLFLRMNSGIGALNLQNLTIIDSLIIDTVVTAFVYDTLNQQFLVTQTDFFSYTSGKIYNRAGTQTGTLITGFSPEVIDILPLNPVGIAKNMLSSNGFELSVYPNPTQGILNLKFEESLNSAIQIQLFNGSGQLVLNQNLSFNNSQIDLSNLPKGLYFLNVSSDERRELRKIILN